MIINKFFKKVKNYLQKSQHNSLFQNNDIFLVEFPKSGVTYLSFLIANALKKRNDEEITFYNHHKYIVDIHQLRGANISRNDCPLRGYRFIKSHSCHSRSYYFVIYILRNPFDVMISYYHFMASHGYNDSFENFLLSKKYGIQNWVNHVEGWLIKNKDLAQRVHLIRYEDLVSSPQHELASLFSNIGLIVDSKKIQEAIESSSRENMKKSEKVYETRNPIYKNSGMSFVRKGYANQKDTLLTEKARSIIYNSAYKIIQEFYSEMML